MNTKKWGKLVEVILGSYQNFILIIRRVIRITFHYSQFYRVLALGGLSSFLTFVKTSFLKISAGFL